MFKTARKIFKKIFETKFFRKTRITVCIEFNTLRIQRHFCLKLYFLFLIKNISEVSNKFNTKLTNNTHKIKER